MIQNSGSIFEKIFNRWVLLFLNLAIVVIVEEWATFFMDTGLIHLIAILFILLGISRIFIHYRVYDQYLKPLIIGGVVTLIFFAISHVLEYVGYKILDLPFETIAINVVNFYLIGLLIISLCASVFLIKLGTLSVKLKTVPKVIQYILSGGIIAAAVAIIYFYFYSPEVDLELSSWLLYLYGTILFVVTTLGVYILLELKKYASIIFNFLRYFIAAFLLISLSATFYLLNEPLEMLGLDYMQIMFLSHFFFYGALSLIFLSYSRLSHLGGIYNEEKFNPQPTQSVNNPN